MSTSKLKEHTTQQLFAIPSVWPCEESLWTGLVCARMAMSLNQPTRQVPELLDWFSYAYVGSLQMLFGCLQIHLAQKWFLVCAPSPMHMQHARACTASSRREWPISTFLHIAWMRGVVCMQWAWPREWSKKPNTRNLHLASLVRARQPNVRPMEPCPLTLHKGVPSLLYPNQSSWKLLLRQTLRNSTDNHLFKART